jgi:hypothetical protein
MRPGTHPHHQPVYSQSAEIDMRLNLLGNGMPMLCLTPTRSCPTVAMKDVKPFSINTVSRSHSKNRLTIFCMPVQFPQAVRLNEQQRARNIFGNITFGSRSESVFIQVDIWTTFSFGSLWSLGFHPASSTLCDSLLLLRNLEDKRIGYCSLLFSTESLYSDCFVDHDFTVARWVKACTHRNV